MEVTVTLTVDPKINRVLPLPQGNHVAKFGKDPIYRTKVIVRILVWTPAIPNHIIRTVSRRAYIKLSLYDLVRHCVGVKNLGFLTMQLGSKLIKLKRNNIICYIVGQLQISLQSFEHQNKFLLLKSVLQGVPP